MKNITLICGLPNAGKTTYSRQFENVIHLDDFRKNHLIGDLCFQDCKDIVLNNDGDICIEGVYNTVKRRRDLLTAIKLKGDDYYKKCIWINTPLNVCCERSKNEGAKSSTIVYSYARAFEEPIKEEGWDEIIEINRE